MIWLRKDEIKMTLRIVLLACFMAAILPTNAVEAQTGPSPQTPTTTAEGVTAVAGRRIG
jgi:hypothetical protein